MNLSRRELRFAPSAEQATRISECSERPGAGRRGRHGYARRRRRRDRTRGLGNCGLRRRHDRLENVAVDDLDAEDFSFCDPSTDSGDGM